MDRFVTVVVVLHNSGEWVASCLRSVHGEPGVEIVVVDNASTDGGADVVRSLDPAVKVVVNCVNRGFATACNQGAQMGSAPLLLFLNPDAWLLPGALQILVDHLRDDPRLGAVGPRQCMDGTCTWQWSAIPFPPSAGSLIVRLLARRAFWVMSRFTPAHMELHRAVWYGSAPVTVPYVSGGCALVRRDAFNEVGGFDEGFFMFFEDTDLSERLRARGWTLQVIPEARAVHRIGQSVKASSSGGESILRESGRRYLERSGGWPARLLWWMASRRGARRKALSASPETRVIRGSSRQWTGPFRLEVSADPAFLFGAAAEIGSPDCVLPGELGTLTAGRPLYWRLGGFADGGWCWSSLRPVPAPSRECCAANASAGRARGGTEPSTAPNSRAQREGGVP